MEKKSLLRARLELETATLVFSSWKSKEARSKFFFLSLHARIALTFSISGIRVRRSRPVFHAASSFFLNHRCRTWTHRWPSNCAHPSLLHNFPPTYAVCLGGEGARRRAIKSRTDIGIRGNLQRIPRDLFLATCFANFNWMSAAPSFYPPRKIRLETKFAWRKE